MTDIFTIKIPNIKIFGNHGCYRQEKNNGQEFDVSIKIFLERSISLRGNDTLDSTLDYVDIVNIVRKNFNLYRYNLLEELAIKISEVILHSIEQNKIFIEEKIKITSLNIKIKKYNPIGMNVPNVELEYSSNGR
ncbi:dihydroneopterin aldolase [Candidatus Marinimicrobia bacterium]|jgi:FolB domain-containing protein|nr:dihydroneopterin aldolase [Candidatus Neomarinimicrobiota bacterium]